MPSALDRARTAPRTRRRGDAVDRARRSPSTVDRRPGASTHERRPRSPAGDVVLDLDHDDAVVAVADRVRRAATASPPGTRTRRLARPAPRRGRDWRAGGSSRRDRASRSPLRTHQPSRRRSRAAPCPARRPRPRSRSPTCRRRSSRDPSPHAVELGLGLAHHELGNEIGRAARLRRARGRRTTRAASRRRAAAASSSTAAVVFTPSATMFISFTMSSSARPRPSSTPT